MSPACPRPSRLFLKRLPIGKRDRESEREIKEEGKSEWDCSDTFMAAAGIIHGNDGTKTDGSGGVDFVEEGEETRDGREREAWKRSFEETISDARWVRRRRRRDGKQSAGKITQPGPDSGPRRSIAGGREGDFNETRDGNFYW